MFAIILWKKAIDTLYVRFASMPAGKPAACLYLLQRKPSPPKPLQLTEPQERQPVITGGLYHLRLLYGLLINYTGKGIM